MTPNKHRGEVLVTFTDGDGKKEHHIARMTHAALDAIETSIGPVGEILERMTSGKSSYKDTHRILYHAIVAYGTSKGIPTPTMERVGDMILETGLMNVAQATSELLATAFVGAKSSDPKAESTPEK